MRIRIFWVGKTRSPQLRALADDYLARIGHFTACEIVETKDLARGRRLHGRELLAAEAAEIKKSLSAGHRRVVLDERGREFTSREFARWLERQQIRGVKGIEFVIGGPDGLSREIADGADLELSLGRMTWAHEISRVLLLEQIYRAFGILGNIPYHREGRGSRD